MNKIVPGILMLILVVSCDSSGSGKNIYVSPSGNDKISYENNSIVAPWKSPVMAWTHAKAGDNVYFREGEYYITDQIDTKYIGNAGSVNAPIVFTSYPGERAVFSTNLTHRVFKIQKAYNHISDIDFIGTAPTWFHLGEDLPAHHFEIRNCRVKLGTGGDNTGFVMTSKRSDYCVIENCTIEGPGVGVHHNTSCLYVGSADYLTVRNNTLYNAPIGIYFKTDNDENSGNEIAFNFIFNTPRNSIQTNSQFTRFHDNIIGSGCGTLQVNEGNGFARGDNNVFDHNTIMSGGLLLNTNDGGADGNTITNNILFSRSPCCDGNLWDYNMYINGNSIGLNDFANTSPTFIVRNPSVPEQYTLDVQSSGYRDANDGNSMGVINAQIVGSDMSSLF